MKILSYQIDSKATYGVAVGDGVVDVGARLGSKYPDLKAVLAAGAIAEAEKAAAGQAADASLDDITFLPVIANADKVICVGLNYATHIAETGRSDSEYPVLFTRFADTGVGHKQPLVRPKVSDKFDYEGELAVIIGKEARHVPQKDALAHVAGYACYNDGSVRDWQRHTHQFIPGKNFPGTGGFGPWMVTADEIPDPSKMTLVTRLNGEEMQKSGTDLMIFTVPFLISYISTFTTLRPGDVIPTGTPGGVGFKREPPVYMKAGDTVEIDIDKVGVLVNTVIDE